MHNIAMVSKSIDVKGKICPYPVMDVRNALKDMEKEEVLEVITDYEPAAFESIPNFCQKKGYPYETVERGGEWSLFITKKE